MVDPHGVAVKPKGTVGSVPYPDGMVGSRSDGVFLPAEAFASRISHVLEFLTKNGSAVVFRPGPLRHKECGAGHQKKSSIKISSVVPVHFFILYRISNASTGIDLSTTTIA